MAISTNYNDIKEKYNPKYWESIEQFEKFFLQEIAETRPDNNYYTDKNGEERIISPINHHPELKEYEVWMEGYGAIEEGSKACLIGKAKARNFAQACHIVMSEENLKNIKRENRPDYKGYPSLGRWDYDPKRLSFWACKLYWSEELARKIYG